MKQVPRTQAASRGPTESFCEKGSEPLWAAFREVQEQMLWDFSDTGRTSRAMVRVGCIITWIALSAVAGVQFAWGLPALLLAPFLILHGQRRWALAVINRSGLLKRFVRSLLPYSKSPGFHPLGLLDFIACCLLGAGTGSIGNAFGGESTHSIAIAATILAAGFIIPGALNMTAHVSWALERVQRKEPWRRPLVTAVSAAFVGLVLWPRSTDQSAYKYLVMVTVLAIIYTLTIGAYGQWLLKHEVWLVDLRTGALRRAVQDADSHHVHQLKNLARSLYEQYENIDPSPVGDRVRDLAIAISTTEHMLRSGSQVPSRGAGAILRGLAGLDDKFALLPTVIEEVDPDALNPGDVELLLIALGDLASNAIKANADHFTVRVEAEARTFGSLISLTVSCRCGTVLAIDELTPNSSLRRLVRKVEAVRGSFDFYEDGTGNHTFTLRWPTTATPDPQSGPARAAGA